MYLYVYMYLNGSRLDQVINLNEKKIIMIRNNFLWHKYNLDFD